MNGKFLFKKPKNELENFGVKGKPAVVPDELCIACPSCKKTLFKNELAENFEVCYKCSHHLRLSARKRIFLTADKDTFTELFSGLVSKNRINFPDYDDKLKAAAKNSGENEGAICGTAKIMGTDCCIFAMDPLFMMGSMGTVVGEKITLLFEYAIKHSLPVVGFTLSGGARMQEGILSLMQMAKTAAAVKKHSDSGNLYIAVLTDPTTGGVTASFAMLGDIILAEPAALIGFAGPRVIEQTIRQKLPQDFQRSEFLLEKGFIDKIVSRKDINNVLGKLLNLHARRDLNGSV